MRPFARLGIYGVALIALVALLALSSGSTRRDPETALPLPTYDASAFRDIESAVQAAFEIPDDLRLLTPSDLCGNLHAAWDQDWQRVIGALTHRACCSIPLTTTTARPLNGVATCPLP